MAYFLKCLIGLSLCCVSLKAKDLGKYGSTAAITEEDLLEFIQAKLKTLSSNEQQAFIQMMQEKIVQQTKKTMTLQIFKKVKNRSTHYFDPSLVVNHDILNSAQEIIVKKGTLFNPLSLIQLKEPLLFFDATDSEQLAWAKSIPYPVQWILIKGQPFQLEEDCQRAVYFDQAGVLTKKFGIDQVPAQLSQENERLKIEYFPMRCL